MADFQKMTLVELREEAKTRGLKGISTMKKGELVDALAAIGIPQKQAAASKETSAVKDEKTTKAADDTKVRKSTTKEEHDKPAKESAKVVADAKAKKNAKVVVDAKAEKSAKVLVDVKSEKSKVDETVAETRRVTVAEPSVQILEPRLVPKKHMPRARIEQKKEHNQVEESRATYQARNQAPRQRMPQGKTGAERPQQSERSASQSERSASQLERRSYNRGPVGERPASQFERSASQPERQTSQPERQPQRFERSASQLERPASQSERSASQSERSASQPGPVQQFARAQERLNEVEDTVQPEVKKMDSGETREGILEIMADNFGFIRCDNYLPGENDVYVSPAQIRRLGLRTGDIVCGNTRVRTQNEKFSALLYVQKVNGLTLEEIQKRKRFEDLTPIFPNERIHLETPGCNLSMRMVDLISPIGKGQRGMIVSPPKAGKTTLLKQIAKAITKNHPTMNLIILLIDERPEEVTDIKESIAGSNVEVIYSTFDELPENHRRVSEMVIERAKRLVEQKQDVVILLDSITRLARAYNMTIPASGRTLSGGLDPAALHMPKKFFGAARNMREGGSLTVLATALVETGSRMDDVVFEEFKGTGNMELQLDRSLSERRVFPAIDLPKSSTRRDDLLLTKEEQEATSLLRRMFNSSKPEDSIETIMKTFQMTKNNAEFLEIIKRMR